MSDLFNSQAEANAQGMAIAYHAQERPDQPALVTPTGDLSYHQLNQKSNQIARLLRNLGLQPGDSLALAVSNRLEFAEVFAATLRIGVRFICINYHLTADEMSYIVDNCEAKVLVADHSIGKIAEETRQASKNLVAAISVGGPLHGFEALNECIRDLDSSNIDEPVSGRLMFYTSGTTGRPKGVVRRRTINRGAVNAAPATRPGALKTGESVVLCTGPFYHAAPMAQNLYSPLVNGTTVIVMDRFDPEETLVLIDRHRVTNTHMVATMFHRLLALPDEIKRKYDLSSLVRVSHGAAPTPVHIKRSMIEWFGPVIYEYYAATETGGCTITPEEWLEKPGSVGKPSAGQILRILDDDGNELRMGEVGTVYFDSTVNGGFDYYKDEVKTKSSYIGDLFTLGDQGYFDEDGYLFLTGRSSELIISGGVNIYPVEIDAVLLMHPAVRDGAVVGVPNVEFGEEVRAVVELNEGYKPRSELAEELIAFCRERLPGFKCPRGVDFIDELPRSAAGKVYRKKVREPYWEGHATT